jgi:fluoride exporter
MSLWEVLGVGVFGALGAISRFLLDGAVSARAGSVFPWGTLAVNLTGACALGAVASALSGDALLLAGTGFLGGYTTFSTWMFESRRLGEDGELGLAALNLFGSLALGLLAVWVGRSL